MTQPRFLVPYGRRGTSGPPGPQGPAAPLLPADESRLADLEAFVVDHDNISLRQFIYFDPASGDDANDGADGSPVKTMARVLELARPSKTVVVEVLSDFNFNTIHSIWSNLSKLRFDLNGNKFIVEDSGAQSAHFAMRGNHNVEFLNGVIEINTTAAVPSIHGLVTAVDGLVFVSFFGCTLRHTGVGTSRFIADINTGALILSLLGGSTIEPSSFGRFAWGVAAGTDPNDRPNILFSNITSA